MRSQFLYMSASRVVGSGLQAIAFLILVRSTSVENVGIVGIVAGSTLFFGTLFDWGMQNVIARSRASGDDAVVEAGLGLNFISTILLTGGGALLILIVVGIKPITLPLMALVAATAIEKSTEARLSVPVADGYLAVPASSILIRRVVAVGLFGLSIVMCLDVVAGYCFATLVGNCAGAAQLQTWFRRRTRLAATLRVTELRRVFRHGTPIVLSNISGQARTLDVAVLGFTGQPIAAGIYAAATRLTSPLMLVPIALATVLVPKVVRLNEKDAAMMALRITLVFVASVVPLAIVGALSPRYIGFVLGREFEGVSLTFALSLLSVPFIALTYLLNAILQGNGEVRSVAVTGVLTALVLLPAMVGAGILFGAPGVAFSVVFLYGAKSVVLGLLVRRLTRRGSTLV